MALVMQHPKIAAQNQQGAKSQLPIGDSSFLQNVDYDATQMQMTVTMKSGAQYLYFQVYPATMESFILAQNKGEFYSKNIKGAHQSTRTIDKSIGKKISHTSKKTRGQNG